MPLSIILMSFVLPKICTIRILAKYYLPQGLNPLNLHDNYPIRGKHIPNQTWNPQGNEPKADGKCYYCSKAKLNLSL